MQQDDEATPPVYCWAKLQPDGKLARGAGTRGENFVSEELARKFGRPDPTWRDGCALIRLSWAGKRMQTLIIDYQPAADGGSTTQE